MNVIITDYLAALKLGELQNFKNMGILPLFTTVNGSPEYVTLKQALDDKLITVTEVDQSGSVPELKVTNTSEQSVLLLDGEELIGAKQNRVLNTSILLKQKSETVIPVSCTEQGRWGYTSVAFAHSGVMMSHRTKSAKMRSVTDSLHAARGYSSDQGRVWGEIERMHRESSTSSPTRAMRDVYTAKSEELDEYTQAFEYVPEQRGGLFFINGEVVGFDVISRQAAYKTIHPQLVKSYALDALLQMQEPANGASISKAEAFLQEAIKCNESKFDSTGLGYDYRLEGSQVIGSALVLDEKVIHMAFFKADESESDPRMSGYMQRGQFRRSEKS